MTVCILGSGLSALILAKALVNQNINVDCISSIKNNKISRLRTLGISKSNFEYINKNLLHIGNIAWKLNKIEIFTENLKNEKILSFKNNNDQLFYIIKNFQIYDLLKKKLLKNKYFKKKYLKSFNEFEKYDLIINTDYSNNITKKFFSKKIVKTYNSLAYTTIIKHKKISNNIATQIFTKKGPLAFLPISDTQTSIVYSITYSKKIKNENIFEYINRYNFKYEILNILAFGDLLHKIHPLAGQGFNMTIRDTKLLIDLIEKKTSLGLPIDKSICIDFEKKIKHKNLIFTTGVDLLYELFNFERRLKGNILSKSIQMFGKNLSLNKIFKKIADEGI